MGVLRRFARFWYDFLIGDDWLAAAGAVAALGVTAALTEIPLSALRVFVGTVLLVFGLQWLRKAILRAGRIRALHDEDASYAREVALAEEGGATAGFDWYGFTLSFKGVLLEGLEVVLIVVTFGSTGGHLGLAAAGAAGALVVVGGVGALVHRPLSRVPENSMKFVVGIMLTSFGVFWGGEGVGVNWPGSDLALLGVIAFFVLVALVLVADLRRRVTLTSRVASSA